MSPSSGMSMENTWRRSWEDSWRHWRRNVRPKWRMDGGCISITHLLALYQGVIDRGEQLARPHPIVTRFGTGRLLFVHQPWGPTDRNACVGLHHPDGVGEGLQDAALVSLCHSLQAAGSQLEKVPSPRRRIHWEIWIKTTQGCHWYTHLYRKQPRPSECPSEPRPLSQTLLSRALFYLY